MDEQQAQQDQIRLIVSTDIPKRPVHDRITVMDQVVHYRKDVGPTAYVSQFTRNLATKEQTYDREIQVNESWQPVSFGWNTDNCGMLILKNVGNRQPYMHTTAEEREAWKDMTVEVTTHGEAESDFDWLIPVNESMRGIPNKDAKLFVRCRKGETTLVVTVIPG